MLGEAGLQLILQCPCQPTSFMCVPINLRTYQGWQHVSAMLAMPTCQTPANTL